jgi:hypothetical protein
MVDAGEVFRALVDRDLLSKITLHRYRCRRGCPIAVVFAVDDLLLCAVRDYKFSPGLNRVESVEAARAKNTLDGDRHWPSHVYDVKQLGGDPKAGIWMACRHYHGAVPIDAMTAAVEGVRPGHAGKPTILS